MALPIVSIYYRSTGELFCDPFSDEMFEDFDICRIEDFSYVKDFLFPRFVPRKGNMDFLASHPFVPFLDFAVVCEIVFLPLGFTDELSIFVDNSIFSSFGVDFDTLFSAAVSSFDSFW